MSSIFQKFYDEGASLVHSVKNAAQESLRPWSASTLQVQLHGLAHDDSRIITVCNEFWSVLQQGSTTVSMNAAVNQFFLVLFLSKLS